MKVDEPQRLRVEQIRRYNDMGHLFPIDILSQAESAEIRDYFDDLLAKTPGAGVEQLDLTNWRKHCRGTWDTVTDSRTIDVSSDLLGDSVILRLRHLPGDGRRVSRTRTPPTGR